MPKDNLIELKNPEPFIDDPITEILRTGIGPVPAKTHQKIVQPIKLFSAFPFLYSFCNIALQFYKIAGKTTWLREVLPDASYFDLLDSSLYLELSQKPGNIEAMVGDLQENSWVVIDEIQKNTLHQGDVF